ncbi:MAG: hypothetical protein WC483_05580 [Candidatus Paceibacterota bacterium]
MAVTASSSRLSPPLRLSSRLLLLLSAVTATKISFSHSLFRVHCRLDDRSQARRR